MATRYPINFGGGMSGMNFITGGGGGSGTLAGAPATGYDPRYGGIPQVPDPRFSTSSAISANQANLPGMMNLAGGINTFNAGQAKKQLELNMPDYNALTAKRSAVTKEQLAGMVPQDVVDLLIQQAAERGIATGSPGSPNANSAYLRALGLTSLNQIATGMQNLSQGIRDTPTAPLTDMTRMMITPDAIQSAQMAANLYASAPVPRAQAEEARRQNTVSTPKYGGASLGIRSPSFSGSGQIYNNPEPQYGTYVARQEGPTYDYQAPERYDAWNDWYNSLPGSGSTSGNAPSDTWGAPIYDPQYDYGSTDSYYDPILDVSINPSSLPAGGGYYDFQSADFGF